MKTSRATKKVLAVLLLGCAVITGACGLRAGAPTLVQQRHATTSAEVLAADPSVADAATRSRAQALLGQLPLYFIENRGQEDGRVAYYLQGRDIAVYFGGTGVTFALTGPKADGTVAGQPSRLPVRRVSLAPERPARARWAVQLDFVGANAVTPRGEQPTPAVISYFKGGDSQSKTGLKAFGNVVYPDLWPGIDLVYAGAAGHLKYTFLVKPGADPDQIRLAYRGATGVTLTDAGQLAIVTPVGGFTDDRPYAYQEVIGGRNEIPAAYALATASADGAQGYSFKVGGYDRTRALVLDPSVLVYAGYIGGSGDDDARGIAVDVAGNAYVVGTTDSPVPSFPASVGPDLIFNGGSADVFVAKVKADGTGLAYLGYIGGAGMDNGTGIAIDKAGNAYVTGFTSSDQTTFPVQVGPDLVYNGGDSDAFVAKVKADGTALVYCGYIGGAGRDEANGIAVDTGGNAYVTGLTKSDQTTFPLKVGPDLNFNGGDSDAFVAKVKADGAGLVYAGYIGGAGGDEGKAIAVDTAGNAYVTGSTDSDETTFPVKQGPGLIHNGGGDAFVAKVKADGTTLLYAGYIGGSSIDVGNGIAVDAAGNAYVTGSTFSDQSTFPVKVGPDLTFNGFSDTFVAKVKAGGTTLLYAGYIGGADFDSGSSIAVDAVGNAYVTGTTSSDESTFPVKVGPELIHQGSFDAFVAKVKTDGTGFFYAGYLGGADFDGGTGIAVDAAGNVYLAGFTASDQTSFPATVGPDLNFNGGGEGGDAFVAKVSGKPDLTEGSIVVSPSVVESGIRISVSDTAFNLGLGTAKPSTTRYYLSTDIVKSANDILLGSRTVPGVEAGSSNFGSATVTVPANTPLGSFNLLVCADDAKVIAENDEANNCVVGSFLQVTRPDLVETAVSEPPQTAKIGSAFSITDTAGNAGVLGAPASTTRYYLSKDSSKGAGDTVLKGTRAVPFLGAKRISVGSTLVTIPNVAAGPYHVLACADDLNVVKEVSDTNNCTASVGVIQATH